MAEPLIIGSNGFVARVDPVGGVELWRTKLLPGLFGSSSCTDVSVVLRDQVIFAGTHGHLFCLDLSNGQILWRNELKGMGFNDVALAMEGVSVQFLSKTTASSSNSSST